EMTSDYIYGRGSQTPISIYTWDATAVNRIGNIWVGCYELISRANLVISELEINGISGVDQDLIYNLIGEAKFLRALAYFHLVRLFGDVPLRLLPENTDFALA